MECYFEQTVRNGWEMGNKTMILSDISSINTTSAFDRNNVAKVI